MKGQTIIEVLVALTTAVVIISAITISVLTALRNAQYSQTQNTATRYAQEGMEFLRFLRDSNFSKFKELAEASNVTYYCLGKGSSTLVPNTVDPNTNPCSTTYSIDNIYSRYITFASDDAYCAPPIPPTIPPSTPVPTIANTSKKVTVIVAWTDGKCPNSIRCHKAQLVSCLSDYTLVPTIGPLPTPTQGL